MDPSSNSTLRTRRLRPTLLWSLGIAAITAVTVEVSRTGLDILFLLLIGLAIIIVERTVGDWLGELMGSGLATLVLGTCMGAGAWVLFEKGGVADRFFAAAANRGYKTAYYQASVPSLPATSGIPAVASTGESPAPVAGASRRTGIARPSGATSSAGPAPPQQAGSSGESAEGNPVGLLFSRREASEISLRVPTPAVTRERLEIRARLTSNGSGVSGSTVAFTANTLPLGASTTGPDGTATVVFSPRLAGRYNIRAHFLGDGRHAGSSATATITVVQGS